MSDPLQEHDPWFVQDSRGRSRPAPVVNPAVPSLSSVFDPTFLGQIEPQNSLSNLSTKDLLKKGDEIQKQCKLMLDKPASGPSRSTASSSSPMPAPSMPSGKGKVTFRFGNYSSDSGRIPRDKVDHLGLPISNNPIFGTPACFFERPSLAPLGM